MSSEIRPKPRRRLRSPATVVTLVLSLVVSLVTALVLASHGNAAPDRPVAEASGPDLRAADEPQVGQALFDPAFTHGQVTVDGTPIHYVRGGSGPAVLLLHGWPETWWAWHDVMPGLAADHTVIAVDLPGLGTSGIPSSGFDKTTVARRLHEAMGKIGVTDVTLVGHDLGVLVAYPYARDYPQDVDRVVVIELPLSGFGLEQFYTADFHFLFNLAPKPLPETILDTADVPAYHGMIYDYAVNRPSIDRAYYYLAYADPDRRSAGYEYYRTMAADAADNLANAHRRLAMPVLTMGGSQSFGLNPSFFQPVADDVRGVTVPNTMHYPPEEDPAFVLGCLGYFLGDTPGTPPAAYAGCAF
jgi:pimeloyl-ACP methyl ester carboxylesterase